MSKKTNPAAIGIFIVGALVLIVAAVLLFGTADHFDSKEKFIAYFEDSVTGLEIGSPVRFKGVKIGEVTDILIRTPNQDRASDAIPVILEINLSQLDTLGVSEVDLGDDEGYRAQIEQGLVAMLEQESFLTGRLFIELDYVPNPPGFVIPVQERPAPGIPEKEIPTVSTGIAQLFDNLDLISTKLAALDYEGIFFQLSQVLEAADENLRMIDTKAISDNLVAATGSLREILGDPNLKQALERLNIALGDLDTLLVNLESRVEPLTQEFIRTAQVMQQALAQADSTLATLERTVGPDSPTLGQIESALAEFENAARAIRALADFLERNPNAFLTGRALPQQ
ncbi:MAG: MlaD family protein [Opitutales bacterium]